MSLLRHADGPDNPPLTRRLRDWWRSEVLTFTDRNNSPSPQTPWGEAHIPAHSAGDWDIQGLNAAQMIWGHSLLGPCSPDELASLADWLKPKRNSRIALLGAGLGGLGLALSRICSCRVVGFEQAEVLLRLCPDRNHGNLRSLDSITVKTERSFDHVVVDGLGHRAGDIAPLLKPAAALVSLRGSVIVRTYCVASEKIRAGERHQRWVAAEPASPQVPIRAELVRQLARTGFEIEEEADTADIHVAAVDACWAPAVDLLRMLNGKPNQKTLAPALVREAERWRERVEMIREGDLSVVEFLARRPAAD